MIGLDDQHKLTICIKDEAYHAPSFVVFTLPSDKKFFYCRMQHVPKVREVPSYNLDMVQTHLDREVLACTANLIWIDMFLRMAP